MSREEMMLTWTRVVMMEGVRKDWILDLAEGRTNRICYRLVGDVRERVLSRMVSGF